MGVRKRICRLAKQVRLGDTQQSAISLHHLRIAETFSTTQQGQRHMRVLDFRKRLLEKPSEPPCAIVDTGSESKHRQSIKHFPRHQGLARKNGQK
jgi:hypothetical protein